MTGFISFFESAKLVIFFHWDEIFFIIPEFLGCRIIFNILQQPNP